MPKQVFFIYSIVVCTSYNGVSYDTSYVVQTNAGSCDFGDYKELPELAKEFLEEYQWNIRDLGYIGELGRIHIVERWKSL